MMSWAAAHFAISAHIFVEKIKYTLLFLATLSYLILILPY